MIQENDYLYHLCISKVIAFLLNVPVLNLVTCIWLKKILCKAADFDLQASVDGKITPFFSPTIITLALRKELSLFLSWISLSGEFCVFVLVMLFCVVWKNFSVPAIFSPWRSSDTVIKSPLGVLSNKPDVLSSLS